MVMIVVEVQNHFLYSPAQTYPRARLMVMVRTWKPFSCLHMFFRASKESVGPDI